MDALRAKKFHATEATSSGERYFSRLRCRKLPVPPVDMSGGPLAEWKECSVSAYALYVAKQKRSGPSCPAGSDCVG
jgi:hypothetical protein